MYDREYEGVTLNFEASGGLIHSSLVLQDKETDSYWSIMKGVSIAGQFAETYLKELPIGRKIQWHEWKSLYPNTQVLSVNGREHFQVDPYSDYYDSEEGFRGRLAGDQRLATKEPIFGFLLEGVPFVVPLSSVAGGKVFQVGSSHIFLYRPIDSEIFQSTVAYISSSGTFGRLGQRWVHSDSAAVFDDRRGVFKGKNMQALRRMDGFDTFWYTWSPLHPETKILRRSPSPAVTEKEPQ